MCSTPLIALRLHLAVVLMLCTLVFSVVLPPESHAEDPIPPESTNPFTLLRDIHPGIAHSNPSQIYELGNQHFFSAENPTTGRELWVTDGTPAGTQGFDLNPGSDSSNPGNLTIVGTRIYFVATKAGEGQELWTVENGHSPQMLDINPGSASATPNNFVVVGTRLYFMATKTGEGEELWTVLDGGAPQMLDINAGAANAFEYEYTSKVFYPTVVGTRLYFVATKTGEGQELWTVLNGGAPQLLDINPGPDSSYPRNMIVVGTRIYFHAEKTGEGQELWTVLDGGAPQLLDINPGPDSSYPQDWRVVGTRLYFMATKTGEGQELWTVLDGGAPQLLNINPGPDSAFDSGFFSQIIDMRLYFRATKAGEGSELWTVLDGGAPQMLNINPGPDSALPVNAYGNAVVVGGTRLYFPAVKAGEGCELWTVENGGIPQMLDINPGPNSALPVPAFMYGNFATVGDTRLYFIAVKTGEGAELWTVENGGIPQMLDINPGPDDALLIDAFAYGRDPTVIGTRIYFPATKTSEGSELWTVEGSGTPHMVDLTPGSASTSIANVSIITFTHGLLVATQNDAFGWEPVIIIGTAADRLDLFPGMGSSLDMGSDTFFTRLNDGSGVLFPAITPDGGRELWVSDGTAAYTRQIADLAPGTANSVPSVIEMREWSAGFLIAADDTTTGIEPWFLPRSALNCNDPDIDVDASRTTLSILAGSDAVSGRIVANDRDGNPLTYTISEPPGQGTVEIDTTGAYTYTPGVAATTALSQPQFTGATDRFVVQVSDGERTISLPITVVIGPRLIFVPLIIRSQ